MSESSAYDKQIYKALEKFKRIRIWPDLKGCLQGLIDIFTAFPDTGYVSHKLIFAKNLSQCLSPALPAGIQSMTLEVYAQVFERIGVEKLARDFYVWAPGLFQFFHCAGVALRVQELKLFNDYFVAALSKNKKIGPPLILAVLPGITDEGSDVKELSTQLVNTIREDIGEESFWRAMFRACLTSPATRSSFFIIAAKNEASAIMGLNINDIALAMFLAVFKDQNILVLRSCLEFFITCFPFMSEDAQKEVGKGCIELLRIDDQSIRRRVFNWITSFEVCAKDAVCSASIEAIKVMLQKGGQPKELVIGVLPNLVERKDFDAAEAAKFIDGEILVKAAKNQYDCLLQLMPLINMSHDLQRNIILHIFNILKETKDAVEAQKLCRISDYIVDIVSEEMHDICKEVLTHIFTYFKSDEIVLSFATKLVGTIDIDAPFEILISEKPIYFTAVHEILRMSDKSLNALLVADKNVDILLANCWLELRKRDRIVSTREICAALLQLYKRYPAKFNISLNEYWDNESVITFIQTTDELPISFLVICYQKESTLDLERKTAYSNSSNTSEVLRTIASRAEYVVNDAKKNINDNDYKWSLVVIESILKLVESFSSMFHASISDQSIIKFVQFLIYKQGTSQLLYALLSTTNSKTILNSVAPIITEYIISQPKDVWKHRLLVPLSNCNIPIRKLFDLINDSPPLLSTLISVLSCQPASKAHYNNVELLCTKLIKLLQTYNFNDSILFDISSLFEMITKHAHNEVESARNSYKSTGIFKILSSTEAISENDCVASLTINFNKDGVFYPYCSLSPRFLPKIIEYIINKKYNTELYTFNFKSIWNLLLFYSFAIANTMKDQRIISSLLSIINEQTILEYFSNLIYIFSLESEENKLKLLSFIECAIRTPHSSFSSPQGVAIFSGMLEKLKVEPLNAIHFIINFINTMQGSSKYHPFQTQFMNALTELKDKESLEKAFELIITISPQHLLNMFESEVFPASLVKIIIANCDKTKKIYPSLISHFMTVPGEGFSWHELIFSIITDENLFSRGKDYLKSVVNMINIAGNDKEKFTTLFFEFISTTSFNSNWNILKEQINLRTIVVLAFVIFSCPQDTFITKQQNINALLLKALQKDGTNGIILKVFSIFMRVLFVRANSKFIESFTSILVHVLSSAFNSDDTEDINQAKILLNASMKKIPSSFQFEEFVFFPDLLSFPDYENDNSIWPILKDSDISLSHLDVKGEDPAKYEEDLFNEFVIADSMFTKEKEE